MEKSKELNMWYFFTTINLTKIIFHTSSQKNDANKEMKDVLILTSRPDNEYFIIISNISIKWLW
jgi:hypothetical protein